MADNSKIEWTDATWSPITGCTRVSAGCDNCYAVTMTRRLAAMGQEKYQGLVNPGKGHFNGVVKCHPDELDKPLRWRKPRRIFVNSMSDLFHEGVPFAFIDDVVRVMSQRPEHQFQVLTKRPERAATYFLDKRNYKPLSNLLIGTSVENQETADERIPHLLRIPASVRFLSCEPLLGPLNLGLNLTLAHDDWRQRLERIDWVIVGGESGPGARPMHPDWARSIRDQCVEAGVAFHFKQWGAWIDTLHGIAADAINGKQEAVYVDSETGSFSDARFGARAGRTTMQRVGKKKAGRLLDGREWNEHPFELEVAQ